MKALSSRRTFIVCFLSGLSADFPIARLKSVRTQASELGAIFNRQFTTKTNRIAQIISVKRIK